MELQLVSPAGSRVVDFSPVPLSDEQATDICAADRRLFFAVLKRMRSTLHGCGLTDEDVRGYFACRFGRSRMRECDQKEWALSAAELQCVSQSSDLLTLFTEKVRETDTSGYR